MRKLLTGAVCPMEETCCGVSLGIIAFFVVLRLSVDSGHVQSYGEYNTTLLFVKWKMTRLGEMLQGGQKLLDHFLAQVHTVGGVDVAVGEHRGQGFLVPPKMEAQ